MPGQFNKLVRSVPVLGKCDIFNLFNQNMRTNLRYSNLTRNREVDVAPLEAAYIELFSEKRNLYF